MQDIRKQFSLDWLSETEKSSQSRTPPDWGQTSFEEAVLFYGGPILKELERSSSGKIGLHDLARSLKDQVSGFEFGTMWEVIMNLTSRSILELADTSDPAGNYIIQLGPRSSSK